MVFEQALTVTLMSSLGTSRRNAPVSFVFGEPALGQPTTKEY